MLDMRKFLIGCACSLALLATASVAGNLVENGHFSAGLTGWTMAFAGDLTGDMITTHQPAGGNPGGGVRFEITSPSANNGHRFFQAIRVMPGRRYRFTADWMGDVAGTFLPPASFTGARNWMETFIFFANTVPAGPADWPGSGAIVYKIAGVDGARQNTVDGDFIDPDGTQGPAWGSMLTCPSTDAVFIAPPPADGVFTATADYMIIAFNLGGRAGAVSAAQSAWAHVDNVRVVPCHDEHGLDCAVDMRYFAWIASNWLACGIDPATSCW